MCGINVIISRQTILKSTIKTMCDVISHRGPDGEGFMFAGDVYDDINLGYTELKKSNYSLALGHRRLAIIDLSESAKQPMNYLNKYWIVFNGEIYNYLELKEELVKYNYSFTTNSDTEVIMAAYDYWGEGCLNKFNGMWSFCIYDSDVNTLFISRDRFGVKPLCYYINDDTIIFSSEIKSILSYSKYNLIADEEIVTHFLKNGNTELLDKTIFKGINNFPKSSFTKIDLIKIDKNIIIEKYYDVNTIIKEQFKQISDAKCSESLNSLIEDSIKLRLRSDVKIGTAFSGGLDSSIILATINNIFKKNKILDKQIAFSTVHKNDETKYCDESEFIYCLLDKLEIEYYETEPNKNEIIQEIKKLIYHMEVPTKNSLMSSWYVYKLIKSQNVKVTLDGQGADEVFCGYEPMFTYYFPTLNTKEKIVEFVYFIKIHNKILPAIKGILLVFIILFKKRIAKNSISFLNKFLYKDFNNLLINYLKDPLEILFYWADRASMAHSIESRMPFMDYRVVEFGLNVSPRQKFQKGYTKYILRKTFEGLLPNKIIWRKNKFGWPIPEEYWFKKYHRKHFIQTIKNSSLINKHIKFLKYIPDNMIFILYRFKYLMRLYMLATWQEVFFKGQNK